jgi:hypothetical protein
VDGSTRAVSGAGGRAIGAVTTGADGADSSDTVVGAGAGGPFVLSEAGDGSTTPIADRRVIELDEAPRWDEVPRSGCGVPDAVVVRRFGLDDVGRFAARPTLPEPLPPAPFDPFELAARLS